MANSAVVPPVPSDNVSFVFRWPSLLSRDAVVAAVHVRLFTHSVSNL